ncbi:MAG: alkaline phosphatase family protein, partial [Gemmatimonadota bacterium]
MKHRLSIRRSAVQRAAAGLIVLVAIVAVGCAPTPPSARAPVPAAPIEPAPALVVLLVVDQLTTGHLERYGDLYTGGLRRVLDTGVRFRDGVHDHAGTYTAPGHASLSTGVHPARSGIVGNDWRVWRDGRWQNMYSAEDPASPILGAPDRPGRSPANLLRGGLADWMLAADPQARVVSVAGKDRSAILLAGRAPGIVYWYHDGEHRFVTSSHYLEQDPSWVVDFNESRLPGFVAEPCWRNELPPAMAARARRDPAAAEGGFSSCADGDSTRALARWLLASPQLDAATFAFAETAIHEMQLGQRGSTDFLAVSLSQADRIGHAYGPWSAQQADNLVRLDRELGGFLDMLDRTIGRDRYVVAFSSDHGVLPMPEYLQEEDMTGRRVNREMAAATAEARRQITEAGGRTPELTTRIAAQFEALDFVEQVLHREALESTAPADSFTVLYRRSHIPGRETSRMSEFDFDVRLAPG